MNNEQHASICFPSGAGQGLLPHHRPGGARPRPQPRPPWLPNLLVETQTATYFERPTSRAGEPLDVRHPWVGLRAHPGCVPWSGESEPSEQQQEVIDSDQPGDGEGRGDDDGRQGEFFSRWGRTSILHPSQ